MKINPLPQQVVLILSITALPTLNSRLSTALAQGVLTPPGSPAPLMKTLDQIEPRTPISQAVVPVIIATPGSYVLTGNLQATAAGMDVITIQSDNVTLDLGGFTIDGGGIGASAIEISGTRQSVVIRDGTVRNFTAPAILGINGRNMQCVQIKALNAVAGIVVGEGSQVVDCQAINHSFSGIDLRGPNCQVRNCVVRDANTGILTADGARVEGCTVSGGSAGIQVQNDCVVRNNTMRANGSACVVLGHDSRIEGNQFLDGTNFGLLVTGTENRIADNHVKGNADNYNIMPGNQLNLLLSELPETIDWPASVKLAGTLLGVNGANGITINSSDVTIDLDGHALVGAPGSLAGVVAPAGVENLELRNGSIVGWGGGGVQAGFVANGHYRDLRISGNGSGLLCGENSIIVNCTTKPNTGQNLVSGPGSVVGPLPREQMEPRIPISVETTPGDEDSSFKITTRGSYYLTQSLIGLFDRHGIEIAASDVTLDLMGHGLVGRTVVIPPAGPSLTGIIVTGSQSNIFVRNGTIKNWSQSGLDAISASNGRYQELRVSGNMGSGLVANDHCSIVDCAFQGNGGDGIRAGSDCIISGCAVEGNGNRGIAASAGSTIKNCTAGNNDSSGIHLQLDGTISGCSANGNRADGILAPASAVSDCVANDNSGSGISVGGRGMVRDSLARGNTDAGIRATSESTVTGCSAVLNTGDGILIAQDCRVVENTCNGNGAAGDGAGIHATNPGNRIEGNTVNNNDRGLDVDTGGNVIVRNTAQRNTQNYEHVALGNTMGEVLNTTGTGGAIPETTSPWANFSF